MKPYSEQNNILSELFILGIGRASASLSSMMKEDIYLTITSAGLYEFNKFENILEDNFEGNNLIVSHQIKGDFNGKTLLFMEQTEIKKLVNAQGDAYLAVQSNPQDAFTEAGDIIAKSLTDSFSRLLNIEIEPAETKFSHSPVQTHLKQLLSGQNDNLRVLKVKFEFQFQNQEISGNWVIIMENQVMKKLYKTIQFKAAG